MVAVGETISEPLSGTLPIFLLIEAEMALVEVQVRVEELPAKMVVGEAEILMVSLAAKREGNEKSRINITMKIIFLFFNMDYSPCSNCFQLKINVNLIFCILGKAFHITEMYGKQYGKM
jgi:hypothetical protein